MSALREALDRLEARQAAAMRGLMDQAREAGGSIQVSPGEIQAAGEATLVGLDVDHALLEQVANEHGLLASPPVVAIAASMPQVAGKAVAAGMAQAFHHGYGVGRLEAEIRHEGTPAPSGSVKVEEVRRAVWEEAGRAVCPSDADLLTKRVMERLGVGP